MLPWRTEQQVARMFCDIYTPDGESFPGDPRAVLKRNLEKASELGYTFYAAPELEFFYFADSGPKPKVLDHGGYFDLTPLDVAQEYRRKTINALEQLGIPIEHSHHEVAPSQHEIIARYTDALTMADNIMTSRSDRQGGGSAIAGSTRPSCPSHWKPTTVPGMHLHLSLFEGDTNAFHEPGTQGQLSKVGRSVHCGSAPSCRRDDRHHQSVGQLLQTSRRWLRRPGVYVVGPQQPVGAGPGAVGQEGQAIFGPGRVPGRRRRLQSLPRLVGDPRRRARRHPARDTSCHPRSPPTSIR